MPELIIPPCSRRSKLVVRPLGEDGPYVVKNLHTGAYYHLGAEEHFLLTQFDGQHDGETIRSAFALRFGQPLSAEDFQDFLDMAKERGFLEGEEHAEKQVDEEDLANSAPLGLRILSWRKSLFNPDRLFTWLAPKITFIWTPAFLVFSAGCIALAATLVFANRHELAGSFLNSLHWQTAVLAWLVLMVVTTLHEFAHGLTCKQHGGEVHEVGFLLLMLMPCFYCNVSDAWLFREKSKRLWVTLAGGYFELFVWAWAVFVWRLTTPDSLVHYLAFVVLSACGVQTLFNFNPLMKLDGYYLLSDWMDVPNLQRQAGSYFKSRLRWLLWGADWPQSEPRGRFLLLYGLVSWLYSLTFVVLSLFVMSHVLGARLGWLGLAAVGLLAALSLRGLFHGITAGEVRRMLLFRHKRTAAWLLVLGGLAGIGLVPIEDRASGPFRVRPALREELRAPVAGFLHEVYGDEGDRVAHGSPVAQLHVPDLDSHLAQKQAEVGEVQARLHMLLIGTRPEEVTEQRKRLERATAWRDLAREDLKRNRQALIEDLNQLDKQIAACRVEREVAHDSYQRGQALFAQRALPEEELRVLEGKHHICRARLAEAEAAWRARQAKGTLEAEAEAARRDKELADVQAALRLLEAGSRPEEIEAERAKLRRLQEEVRHLEEQRRKQSVSASVPGLVTTPRVREKVGQYLREGDLICVIEQPGGMEVEIALAEQDVARVQSGQSVHLKARALPFDTFVTRVERIAPAAGRGEVQSSITVYCPLDPSAAELRPEMTGHARIYTSQRRIGAILLDRILRYIRTEFWW